MPAENPRELVADERFIEFANRSLEDLFLFNVDQVVSSRGNCATITSSLSQQQPIEKNYPTIPSAAPVTNCATASGTTTTATTTTSTFPSPPDGELAWLGDDNNKFVGQRDSPPARRRHTSSLTASSPSSATNTDDDEMAPDNSSANSQQPAAGRGDNAAGQPFYEQQRKKLQALLKKRAELDQKLALREEEIYEKETAYLENTPAGNVMTGFDNYTKGTTQAAAAQRRKTGPLEQHRVFSRSSISYNPNAASDSATTPGSSHAPTPVSSSFGVGGGGSNHPTPTTTGGAAAAQSSKDRKKKGVAGVDAGDSESDAKEMKKVRTNFGATRK